ncbi:hypothetical protein [uncultured Dialister sp.]|uniref:hypothetical protein n=1 Tax=Dialister succinatiphilus TaxID=487173 RepID=UPI00266EC9E9|nr:hypothetical protein [uncultured Dialister sp.]
MSITHKIQVNVTDATGSRQPVLSGGLLKMPKRLAKLLFGPAVQVILLSPGKSVSSIVIKEVSKNEQTGNG